MRAKTKTEYFKSGISSWYKHFNIPYKNFSTLYLTLLIYWLYHVLYKCYPLIYFCHRVCYYKVAKSFTQTKLMYYSYEGICGTSTCFKTGVKWAIAIACLVTMPNFSEWF